MSDDAEINVDQSVSANDSTATGTAPDTRIRENDGSSEKHSRRGLAKSSRYLCEWFDLRRSFM